MLRKADNVILSWERGGIFRRDQGKAVLYAGSRGTVHVANMSREQFDAAERAQKTQVCFITRIDDRSYWKFQDRFYWDDEGLAAHQVHALLATRQQRRDAQVQRAEQTFAMGTMPRQNQRGAISDEIKHFVWTRDGGTCRTCGSTSELQFDHVIPVSMGGSSEPENLQILCGPCNRRKGARVTG